MQELAQRLRELVEQGCRYPERSRERQKVLDQIFRLTQGRLWRSSTPGYEDVLQQTWLYFCRNVCEKYDPDRGASVLTWLNNYLKWRLRDLDLERQAANRNFVSAVQSRIDQELIDMIDLQPAPPDVPPILDKVRLWAETDKDRALQNVHIKNHPIANCQCLILRRLPPEMSWQDIAQEVGVKSIQTLSSLYQRKCVPLVRNFCESEGYVLNEDETR
jgi:hypothetical protein